MPYNRDLTDQYISESYQRLLQVSGSDNVILDGTGSAKQITVEGTITATQLVGAGSGITGITASASPAGPNTSVQYKDGAETSGSSDFTFDEVTGEVSALIFSGSGENLTNIYELQIQAKQQFPSHFKDLTYSGGNLSTSSMYEDSSKTSLIFDNTFEYYGSGELSQSIVTRYSDNKTLTKRFAYTNGSLVNINVEA